MTNTPSNGNASASKGITAVNGVFGMAVTATSSSPIPQLLPLLPVKLNVVLVALATNEKLNGYHGAVGVPTAAAGMLATLTLPLPALAVINAPLLHSPLVRVAQKLTMYISPTVVGMTCCIVPLGKTPGTSTKQLPLCATNGTSLTNCASPADTFHPGNTVPVSVVMPATHPVSMPGLATRFACAEAVVIPSKAMNETTAPHTALRTALPVIIVPFRFTREPRRRK